MIKLGSGQDNNLYLKGNMKMNIIETKDLSKYYGKTKGIDGLNLSVEEGDFFGFIGPNGAGKSTTIRTLLGLISPTSGSGKVLGLDIVEDKVKILSSVGYLPSEVNFYSGTKVGDILKYSADLRGKDCKAKAAGLCERLALDVSKKTDSLSLGNKKKVGVVAALQHSPDLIILDEPTSGLDPLMQRELLKILEEENQRGATIFFSSHILSEVQNHCKTAAFIKDGTIIMSDRVEKLEETGAKKVFIRGAALPDLANDMDGAVSNFSQEEGQASFLYSGDVKKLLAELSRLELEDVTITEPSLEEIFMNYYEK